MTLVCVDLPRPVVKFAGVGCCLKSGVPMCVDVG